MNSCLQQSNKIPATNDQNFTELLIEMTELLNEDNQQKVKVVKKQAWPLYAIILFAVALIFLMFHFYNYGITLESISNRQPMELKQQKR